MARRLPPERHLAAYGLTWPDVPAKAQGLLYSYGFATNTSALATASWNAVPGSGATTTYRVPSLADGNHRYYFRLRATNGSGDSAAAQTSVVMVPMPTAAVSIGDAALQRLLNVNTLGATTLHSPRTLAQFARSGSPKRTLELERG